MTKILYPKTSLFPNHPQILHQMVLQFFLMADKYEDAFVGEEMPLGIVVPSGSYFDTGLTQAALYRYRLQAVKPSTVFLISYAPLPDDVTLLWCSYDALHTFFGEMKVNQDAYANIPSLIRSDTLFARYAEPLIAQLPFLRSYQKIDSIVPLIFNSSTVLDRKKIRKSIYDSTGSAWYVCVIDDMPEHLKDAANAYEEISTEQLLTFVPDQRIS